MGMIFTKNLIAGYPFEGNVNDVSGAHHGTSSNVGFENGVIGKAATFNGSNSYIKIPDADDFSFTDGTNDLPFSISFRVKFNDTSNQWLISKRDNARSDEWQIAYYSGELIFWLFSQGSRHNSIGRGLNFTPEIGRYYHFICTYDGGGSASGMQFYIDTVSLGWDQNSGVYIGMENGGAPILIGKASFNSHLNLNGSLDNLKIYNRALTQQEVKRDYLNLAI